MSVENTVPAASQRRFGMNISWIMAVFLISSATSAPSLRWSAFNKRCPSDGVVTAQHLLLHARNTTIDLSHCGLTDIQEGSFNYVSELKYLIVSNNNLRYIPQNMFVFNSKLVLVDFSNNPSLLMPDKDSFLISSSITELLLANCDIKSVSSKTFKNLPKLIIVNLEGNPVCDTIQCNRRLYKTDADDKRTIKNDELLLSEDKMSPVLRRKLTSVLSNSDDNAEVTRDVSEVRRLRHFSNFVSIVLLSAASVILVFGYVITFTLKGHKWTAKGHYQEVSSEDDIVSVEVVTPIKEKAFEIHRRGSWKQTLKLAYLIATHSREFGMCPVTL